MDPRIGRIVIHLLCNFQAQITIPALAGIVHLSPSHLEHLFKSETGTSVQHFLKAKRIEHARELLETTCISVKEVMVQSGLNDASHFVRDFESVYGATPRRYRQQYRDDFAAVAVQLCLFPTMPANKKQIRLMETSCPPLQLTS